MHVFYRMHLTIYLSYLVVLLFTPLIPVSTIRADVYNV
jgi:hypothetical protein